VDKGVAEDIDLALSEIRARAITIALSGVGYFSKGVKARVLWMGVTPCDELNHLQTKVDAALVRMNVASETRRFSPHVTIARLKRPDPAPLNAYVKVYAGFGISPIHIDSFVLHSSFLSQFTTI